ncbi:2-C-methyl-D-erythritol 4-phosphate cytidylyltransferase [Derxia gummosa]|uniref:2-C-methyl-D-erythritol 4-phosphate cytidylyltransferase n=1 Tax=Derxia gummosa DSM 723 TaxID=1121388 RepID=A0A8B6X3N2_9BURK|nr:2-C-methyl-D-erythritol 4-phosphate cytidylyltransferase [Derxia gummosa]
MTASSARFIALIPAAGGGSRADLGLPKQYADIGGRSMLDRTLDAFRASPLIDAVYVVLAPDDRRFDLATEEVRPLYVGGASRRDSVLAGLNAIAGSYGPNDWVLVHDAARPGITTALIADLIDACRDDAVGGLLALPVADTLKRASGQGDEARVGATLPRDGLWAAQTPQMFRLDLLRRAYAAAPDATDEAGAVEAMGHAPRLVPGSQRNFKLTWREDFALARHLFANE